NRDLRRPDVLHQLKPVNLREHDIQKDQVKSAVLQQFSRLRPVIRTSAGIPCFFQAHPDQIGDCPLILNCKNSDQLIPLLFHIQISGKYPAAHSIAYITEASKRHNLDLQGSLPCKYKVRKPSI